MQGQSKINKVILVSILNLAGFVMQLIGASIAANNSNDDLLISISTAISFIWISAFTVNALRHSKDANYPAVAVTAMAWPSYAVAFFALAYLADYFGFKAP
jgi:hypothetical protein